MKCVTVIVLVLCGILCTAYSAPVSTQEHAKVQEVLNLLNQMAKQQSNGRIMTEEALARAMKLASAQIIGPCPRGLVCFTP